MTRTRLSQVGTPGDGSYGPGHWPPLMGGWPNPGTGWSPQPLSWVQRSEPELLRRWPCRTPGFPGPTPSGHGTLATSLGRRVE